MATPTNVVLIREPSEPVYFELWISDQHNLEARLVGQVPGVASVERNYLFPDLHLVYVDPRWEVEGVVDGVIAYLRDKLAGTIVAGKGMPEVKVSYMLRTEQGAAST